MFLQTTMSASQQLAPVFIGNTSTTNLQNEAKNYELWAQRYASHFTIHRMSRDAGHSKTPISKDKDTLHFKNVYIMCNSCKHMHLLLFTHGKRKNGRKCPFIL